MIKKLRKYLEENKLDYLLINTTDEFLVEYNELCNCARYFVTGFTGSTGDVLLSKENVRQFVDGRYHEQADAEVDHKTIEVVKLQLGQIYSSELAARIKDASTMYLRPRFSSSDDTTPICASTISTMGRLKIKPKGTTSIKKKSR